MAQSNQELVNVQTRQAQIDFEQNLLLDIDPYLEDWADAVGDHFFYRPGFLPMDATRITIVEQALETKNTYEFHESLKRRFPDRMN